jgi:hypothetical protein
MQRKYLCGGEAANDLLLSIKLAAGGTMEKGMQKRSGRWWALSIRLSHARPWEKDAEAGPRRVVRRADIRLQRMQCVEEQSAVVSMERTKTTVGGSAQLQHESGCVQRAEETLILIARAV